MTVLWYCVLVTREDYTKILNAGTNIQTVISGNLLDQHVQFSRSDGSKFVFMEPELYPTLTPYYSNMTSVVTLGNETIPFQVQAKDSSVSSNPCYSK